MRSLDDVIVRKIADRRMLEPWLATQAIDANSDYRPVIYHRAARARRAGIAGQVVEAPQVADRRAHHALAIGGVADIAGRADDVEAPVAQRLHLLRPARVVGEVVDRHLRAVARELRHQREADAGGAAGDQRRLALEVVGDGGHSLRSSPAMVPI